MRNAQYSDNGDIIITMQQRTNQELEEIGGFNWSITQEELKIEQPHPAKRKTTSGLRKASKIALSPLHECADQVRSLKDEVQSAKAGFITSARNSLRKWGKRLTQPIYISKRRKKVTKTNRLFLFFSDSFRFGLTFSLIFGILFVGLNYQSFWAIASDHINPVATLQKQQELTTKIDSVLAGTTQNTRSTVRGNTSILAHLPAVGPEINQLIIPKLGLTAPITTPEYEALLREDWTKLEKDIQDALEDGVVHYPGTAEAGQPGNFFITGHSSYYSWAPGNFKSIFAKLHLLNVGDEYYVYYKGDKHKYVITEKKEVQPNNVHVLDQPLDKRMSTLMTCTPVGTTLRRLILTAQEVDPTTNVALEVGEEQKAKTQLAKPAVLPI